MGVKEGGSARDRRRPIRSTIRQTQRSLVHCYQTSKRKALPPVPAVIQTNGNSNKSMADNPTENMLLKCRFTSTETVGLLGTGAQDVHLDSHTAPEL